VIVWMTALCVVLQSVGAAAGGFVCIGCPNTAAGVAISSAPCNEIDACCSDQVAPAPDACGDSCPDHDQHSDSQDCGCVDISISVNASTLSLPPLKFTLSATAYADQIPALVAIDDFVDDGPRLSWTVRGGPPIVWSLAPSLRRTVLLI